MTTLLAPASRCLRASAALVKRPVDSTTTSTPSSRHGSPAGSRSASILIVCDPARMESPSTVTSTSSGPSTVSYFSRCANVATSPRSLAATISMPAVLAAPACTARQKLRPIRPNPLMPTRTVTAEFSLIVVLLAPATRRPLCPRTEPYRTPAGSSPRGPRGPAAAQGTPTGFRSRHGPGPRLRAPACPRSGAPRSRGCPAPSRAGRPARAACESARLSRPWSARARPAGRVPPGSPGGA